ncbi:MAG TPA: hypothetical protein VGE52_09095, partial [Pirellulales bacterium]
MSSWLPRFAFVVATAVVFCLGPAAAYAADEKEAEEATHESLAKEFVSIVKSAAKAIDDIEDDESAAAAAATFDKLTKKVDKLGKAIKELDEPTEDDEKALTALEESVKKASDKFAESANGLKAKLDDAEAEPKTQAAVGESL